MSPAGAFGSFPPQRGQQIDAKLTRRSRRADPTGSPEFSVLHPAAAATSVAESAAGQQHDYDNDEEDREHHHLPGGSVGLASRMCAATAWFACGR
jgi:hypothetical protein